MKLLDILKEALEDEVLGDTPIVPLSKVDRKVAKVAVGAGDGTDVVSSKKISVPCYKLKPSQKEIVLEKAFTMALSSNLCGGKYQIGGDLGAIVSNDYYIMDGHHRWAMTMLVAPDTTMLVTQLDLDAKTLVSVLNVITVGEFDRTGNDGKGDIKNFNSSNLLKLLEKCRGGYKLENKWVSFDYDDIYKGIEIFGNGSFENGLKTMLMNADKVATYDSKKLKNAPTRFDMPVIEPEDLDLVVYRLNTGYYDLTEPYSDEVLKVLKR